MGGVFVGMYVYVCMHLFLARGVVLWDVVLVGGLFVCISRVFARC